MSSGSHLRPAGAPGARAIPATPLKIRACAEGDLDALYGICLATGDSGADGTHLYADPQIIGHVFAAPYAIYSPQCAFVVEDEEGVGGYILGALDTRAFEDLLEARWWPDLRLRYADPSAKSPEDWSADELRAWHIHHPPRTPSRIALAWPAHLHIDLLPRLQGRGVGRAMMDVWLAKAGELGSKGVHLGVGAANARAIGFYRAYGWREPQLDRPPPAGVLWLVLDL